MKQVSNIQLKVKKIPIETQQGKTGNGGQSKQVPEQATPPGGPYPHPGGTGGGATSSETKWG